MISAGMVAVAVWVLAPVRRAGWAAAAAAAVIQPAVTMAGGVGWVLLSARRRLRRRRHDEEAAAADVGSLAELVALGLSAGLTLRQALATAASHVHPLLEAEVEAVLRRATHGGLAVALAETAGHGHRLYVVSARAVVTGAPLVTAIDGFAREMAAERHARQLEAVHRLPVRLMVPLALFILPGFVLLTVGPAVLAALDRVVLPG